MTTADNYARNALTHVELESAEVASVKPSLTVVSLDFRLDYYLGFLFVSRRFFHFFFFT